MRIRKCLQQLSFNQQHSLYVRNNTIAAWLQNTLRCTDPHSGSKKGLHLSQHAVYGGQRNTLDRSALRSKQTDKAHTFFTSSESLVHAESFYCVRRKEHLWETKNTRSTLCKVMLRFKPRSVLLWCDNWATVTACKAHFHSFQLSCALQMLAV